MFFYVFRQDCIRRPSNHPRGGSLRKEEEEEEEGKKKKGGGDRWEGGGGVGGLQTSRGTRGNS